MGDVNQLAWVRSHRDSARAPILEVGSRNYGDVSMDYRNLFDSCGLYIGTDMTPGPGVDVVADLTTDFASLPRILREQPFRTILCLSVLEHVRDVYGFAANLRRLLAPHGIVFMSVPWVWRFHGYPSDYWRFSPEALKFLFDPLVLDNAASCLSYQQAGRMGPLSSEALNVYPDYEADTAPVSRVGQVLERAYQKVTRRFAPRLSRDTRQVLYPTMINAVFRAAA